MSKAREAMEEARRLQWEETVQRDAERIGIDPAAWKRICDRVLESPLAHAVYARIAGNADPYRGEEPAPLEVVLATLLADAIEMHDDAVKRLMDYAMSAPLPSRIKVDGF